MIITIGGSPGAGKGSVGKLLAKKLNYGYYSMGDIWGEHAQKLGMTLNEFHEHLTLHPEYDRELDAYHASLGKKDNIIVDSRLGFHFIPHSFKVYLQVNPEEASRRVLHTSRSDEHYKDLNDAWRELAERKKQESQRHKALYGADGHDLKNFDIVIDTTVMKPEAVVEAILKRISKYKK